MAPTEHDSIPMDRSPTKALSSSLKIVDKALEIPIINDAVVTAAKLHNEVAAYPVVNQIETILGDLINKAETTITPCVSSAVTSSVSSTVAQLDDIACTGLDQVTTKVPALKLPTVDLATTAVNMANAVVDFVYAFTAVQYLVTFAISFLGFVITVLELTGGVSFVKTVLGHLQALKTALDAVVQRNATKDATEVNPAETEDATEVTPAETEDATEVTPAETEDATEVTPADTEDATKVNPAETEDATEVTPAETEDATEVTPAETEGATEVTPADMEDATEVTPVDAEDATEVTPAETEDATEVSPSENSTEVTSTETKGTTEVTSDEMEDASEVTPAETEDSGAEDATEVTSTVTEDAVTPAEKEDATEVTFHFNRN